MHLWLRYARSDEQWLVVATTRRDWALDLCWDTLQRCGVSARKVRRRTEIVLEVPLANFVEASRILKQQRQTLRPGHAPDLLSHPVLVSGVSAIYGGVIGGASVVLLDMLRASLLENSMAFNGAQFQMLAALGWAIGALVGLGLGWRSVKKARPQADCSE